MIYGTYSYLINGVYKATYNSGAHVVVTMWIYMDLTHLSPGKKVILKGGHWDLSCRNGQFEFTNIKYKFNQKRWDMCNQNCFFLHKEMHLINKNIRCFGIQPTTADGECIMHQQNVMGCGLFHHFGPQYTTALSWWYRCQIYGASMAIVRQPFQWWDGASTVAILTTPYQKKPAYQWRMRCSPNQSQDFRISMYCCNYMESGG